MLTPQNGYYITSNIYVEYHCTNLDSGNMEDNLADRWNPEK